MEICLVCKSPITTPAYEQELFGICDKCSERYAACPNCHRVLDWNDSDDWGTLENLYGKEDGFCNECRKYERCGGCGELVDYGEMVWADIGPHGLVPFHPTCVPEGVEIEAGW